MSRAIIALCAVLTLVSAAACDKVPLLAPSQSTITLILSTTTIPVNGTAQVIATVIEQAGTPVQNGTLVTFTGSLGTFDPPEATTVNGKATTTFKATSQSGTAKIGAVSGAAKATEVEVKIGGAAADRVTLRASPPNVPTTGGIVTLIATVTDVSGNPLPGAPVVFSADNGNLSSNSATTDENGEARVALTTTRETVARAVVGGKEGTVTIRTTATPQVTMTFTPAAPIVGQSVVFTITNAGGATANPITNATIDFGDGDPPLSLGPVPATGSITTSHIYRRADTYTARVTVTDSVGTQSFATTSVTVIRVTPTVTVTASPSPAAVNQTVTATVTVTNPQNIGVRSVVVRWGDGTESALGAPQSGSTTAQHRYQTVGNYTITAVLTDVNNGENTNSTAIEIRAQEAVEVDFTFTPPGLFNPRAVFTVTQPPSSTGVAFYTWNFGDGTPPEHTTNRTIEHAYTLPGGYDVTLTVTFTDGRAFSRTKRITIP